MRKVITYGTYDLLHYGHIRLLERAKALGDYFIVGVTADSFDKVRGKINVSQSLTQRIENVRKTGLADEIIVEEYEGQKIDDIKRLDVDVFTVGPLPLCTWPTRTSTSRLARRLRGSVASPLPLLFGRSTEAVDRASAQRCTLNLVRRNCRYRRRGRPWRHIPSR